MDYKVKLKKRRDGSFQARCPSGPMGLIEKFSDREEEVLENMRNEIRYQLEWCPCSGVSNDYVQLVVDRSANGSP